MLMFYDLFETNVYDSSDRNKDVADDIYSIHKSILKIWILLILTLRLFTIKRKFLLVVVLSNHCFCLSALMFKYFIYVPKTLISQLEDK